MLFPEALVTNSHKFGDRKQQKFYSLGSGGQRSEFKVAPSIQEGHAPPRGPGGLFLAFPLALCCGSTWLPLPLHQATSSVFLLLCESVLRTLIIGFGANLNNPGLSFHLKIFNYIRNDRFFQAR